MEEDEAAVEKGVIRARHIKKRALKNKSLSVSFDEKDLKNFVGGFHKRKKKRRKEALQQQEEALRRKRIEARKKRKLEREFAIYGGAQSDSGTGPDDSGEDDEETEPVASVSGLAVYDNGDVQVTVKTSEISHDEEYLIDRQPQLAKAQFLEKSEKSKQRIPVNKKQHYKKAQKKNASRAKPQNKRDRKKGKKKNK